MNAVCVLGAFQLSKNGALANWHTGAPDAIPAVGAAMDLAIGAKRAFVMTSLFTTDGTAKLVPACTYATHWVALPEPRLHRTRHLRPRTHGDSEPRIRETFGRTTP
jgi:3-oxoadipate CoA-transferase beta subunit